MDNFYDLFMVSPLLAGGAVFLSPYWQDLSILSPEAEGCSLSLL
ncbi:Uncharacterised protein [Salmonella enterica subsp. enterica]|nr:Uncharacterised protein [Salmonella enterica subsp. enterica]